MPAPTCVTSQTLMKSVTAYVRASLRASYNLLGQHPFTKLDILVLSRSYSGLGLASPNLIFLSQSVLSGRVGNPLTSMLIRISHEISHSWFGLVIGALDWTEEWLSEGFATFCEDYIHTHALAILKKECPKQEFESMFGDSSDGSQETFLADTDEANEMRALIRYLTLNSELQNIDDEAMQKLRPTEGHKLQDLQRNVDFVKNGLNPQMSFTQVRSS